MHTEERHRLILSLLDPYRVLSIDALIERLDASPATVRRDLAALSKRGLLRRVHGGAVPIESAPMPSRLVGQQTYQVGEILNVKPKRAIAARALKFCKPGDILIIDGGTTTNLLAQMLPDDAFQIFTTSLPIVLSLLQKPRIRLLMSGGEIFREQNIVLSPYEDPVLENFTASRIFIGAQAVTRGGLMQSDPLLVQNERRLIGHAQEIVALVDSSKFSAQASLSVCPLTGIDKLITDNKISDSAAGMIKKAGVELIKVPVPK